MNVRTTIRRALARAASVACLTAMLTSAGCDSVCELFTPYPGCDVGGTAGCFYHVLYDEGLGCDFTNSAFTDVMVNQFGGKTIENCDRVCSISCLSCSGQPCK